MSSSVRTTWTPQGHIELWGATDGTLYLHPGKINGDQFTIAPPNDMTADQMLAVADRILVGVQQWRDTVARTAERKRTTDDELAAARAEIDRLKAEREDGEAA